jgi:hypothetical protein
MHRNVTEPIAVPDVFVSGVLSIEAIGGGCVRYTCYVNQTSPHDGTPERVICLRVVLPREAVIPAMLMAGRHVGFHIAGELPGGEG